MTFNCYHDQSIDLMEVAESAFKDGSLNKFPVEQPGTVGISKKTHSKVKKLFVKFRRIASNFVQLPLFLTQNEYFNKKPLLIHSRSFHFI